jgi:hypothetical protein
MAGGWPRSPLGACLSLPSLTFPAASSACLSPPPPSPLPRSFGRLLDAESLLTMRKIEATPTGPQNRPRLDVLVAECGEL